MDHRMYLEVFDHAYLLYRPTGMCPRPVNHLDLNHHHILIIYDLVATMTHKFSDFFTFVQGFVATSNKLLLYTKSETVDPTTIPYDDNKFQRVSVLGFGRQKSSWNFH